jgi:glycosyltransferase involved in cell wall biosynthesis
VKVNEFNEEVLLSRQALHMKILAATDIVSGVALALILQTGMRLSSFGIGWGEVVLAMTTVIGLVLTAKMWGSTEHSTLQGARHWGVLLALGYLFVGLLPLTLYYSSIDLVGSSLRDWIAYVFSLVFLCSLAFRPTHYRRISAALAVGLIVFWGSSLVLGSDDIWYYGRFRGAALNPNQVALYVLSGLVLLLVYLRQIPLILVAFIGLAIFGFLSKSNALKVATVVFVAGSLLAALIPYSKIRSRLPLTLLAVAVIGFIFQDALRNGLEVWWASADFKDARRLLFEYGIAAWLSSGFNTLFGFGAGSFSGMEGSFMGSEVHNTVIDALTIGGLPMLCAVYVFPVSALFLAYRQGKVLTFSALLSLIVFSLFHFVARQPVYWLAGYGAFVYLLASGGAQKPKQFVARPPVKYGEGLKILYVSYFFPPYNAIGAVRTGKTVKRLIEGGHDVRVVSAMRQGLLPTLEMDIPQEVVDYTDWIDVDMFMARALGRGAVNKIKSTGAAPQRKSRPLARLIGVASRLYVSWMHIPDRYIGWYPFARKACRQLVDEGWRPDVIYASATPYTALMVASGISKQYGIPWVGELRDLWTDNPYAHHRALSRWLERRTLRTAAALVTVSEPLAEILRHKYDCPCHVIMNGYDAEDFAAPDYAAQSGGFGSQRLRIVYTGQLYAGRRDPTMLFQTLELNPELKSRVQIDFYGRNLDWVIERAGEYGLHDVVQVHEPVSRREAIEIQMQADVLLLLTWNDPRERGVLTGKLFEYIGARRPILVLGHIDGDAAGLVCRERFGVASNEPAEIAGFIAALLSDPSIAASYERAFHARAGSYERGLQVEQLLQIFHDIHTHSSGKRA